MKLFVIFSTAFALAAAKPGYEVAADPEYGYQGPAAPLAHDGTVLDTPEVAHAKAAHLAAHAAAAARAAHGHSGYEHQRPVYGYEDPSGYDAAAYSAPYHQNQGYHGPPAPLAHDGRVVDTPEVAHAKAVHLAAHAHAAARVGNYRSYEDEGGAPEGGAFYGGQPVARGHAGYVLPVQVHYAHASPVGYRGPLAPLGHDGRVIDTPEVAHARAAHLQAYAHAAALASRNVGYSSAEAPSHESQEVRSSGESGPSQEQSYYYITLTALSAVALAKPGHSGYKSGWNSVYGPSVSYGGYHGPSAPLSHDGRVIETPEVAHAKAAHLAAHAEAAAKASWGGPSDEDDHGYHGGQQSLYGYASPAAAFVNNVAHHGHGYHGPPAPLDHEGRVVDTPDVAHLKAAHFAAHAEAAAKAAHYGGGYGSGFEGSAGYGGYHGPAAPLAHDGRVVDTPEVAHAKAAHLAAHHSAASSVGHGPSYYRDAVYAHGSAPSYYRKW
ncbi:spidroin-2-like [Athalia rosae]|uniref:spidroin-2-like n=1 Tax=Athalia rosae TaxID=37344 RepID=UPI002034331C|nr:spidroin-2-like [Athalia rosae]